MYIPVVTLPTDYGNRLYEKLIKDFAYNLYWNRYRCQITNQTVGLKNYLVDSVFDRALKFLVLAFENQGDRTSFSKYYTPTVEIKDYNVLINQQPFSELPVRDKKNL